jgi:hypothetical protein
MKKVNSKDLNWKMIVLFVFIFIVISEILSGWDDFKEGLFSAF